MSMSEKEVPYGPNEEMDMEGEEEACCEHTGILHATKAYDDPEVISGIRDLHDESGDIGPGYQSDRSFHRGK